MSVTINYNNNKNQNISSNLVLFVGEEFNISGLKKVLSRTELTFIDNILKKQDLTKKIIAFDLNSKKKIIINY